MLLKGTLIALPLAAVATVSSMSYAIVDVREGGAGGHRIVVPVPLLAVQGALALAPRAHTRVPLEPGLVEHVALAREMLAALREAPDAELVRVEDERERVVVRKAGDELFVEVAGDGENVAVRVPLEAAERILDGARNGRIDAGDVIAALKSAHHGDLVNVQDGDDHVRVYLW